MPTESETDEMLTTETVAAELDFAAITVRSWRRTGGGPPYIKLGRSIRYSRRALTAWLAARTVGGAS